VVVWPPRILPHLLRICTIPRRLARPWPTESVGSLPRIPVVTGGFPPWRACYSVWAFGFGTP
jgi:hypothetical protein